MSTLKQLRLSKKLTQQEAATILGVSLRSYKEYENNEVKVGTLKYRSMVSELEKHVVLDEEHGILTLDEIKQGCKAVLDEYDVKYCILFGSYAKGKATEKSDVDLLISAKKLYNEKKYKESLEKVNLFLELSVEKRDEALFLQGQLYESQSNVKNIKKALESYNSIISNYPSSKVWEDANKRIIYLNRFYLKGR